MSQTVFTTKRLIIRRTTAVDVDLLYDMWTNPLVMRYVGFPQGLRTTKDAIRTQLENEGDSEFGPVLIIVHKTDQQPIGQCKLGKLRDDGLVETDVKLKPEFWGHKYGREVKQGLVDYLFTHTDCQIIQATPNIHNHASIHMQEAVGGVRVGEGVFEFPPEMQAYTTPVPHYIYHVFRHTWEQTTKRPLANTNQETK